MQQFVNPRQHGNQSANHEQHRCSRFERVNRISKHEWLECVWYADW
jgi:hypothetical protein